MNLREKLSISTSIQGIPFYSIDVENKHIFFNFYFLFQV